MVFQLTFFAYGKEDGQFTALDMKECFIQGQKQSLASFIVKERLPFVSCTGLGAEPKPVSFTNLIEISSSKEMSFIANNVYDSAHCFDVSAQTQFIKFYSESGLHPQAMGANGDAGLGQLTLIAIEDVQRNQNMIWKKIANSEKQSCKNLKTQIEKYGVKFFFNFEKQKKCHVIYGELGILRNIVFSFSLSILNQRYVENSFQQMQLAEAFVSAGYEDAPLDKIKKMLVSLSYNNGGKSSVHDLKDFLLSRADFIQRRSQELWRQSQMTASERGKFLRHVGADDFNFLLGQQRFKNLEMLASEFVCEKDLGPYLRNTSASLMGFPEWLRIWQSYGGPGYMNGLAISAQMFSNKGLRKCVDLSTI